MGSNERDQSPFEGMERVTRCHPLVGGRRGQQEYCRVRLLESYQLILLAVSPHQVPRLYSS